MKLKYIKIRNFGKLKEKEITFQDGINIIYGPNESGKSTIHSFVRGMFFGLERYRGRASKNDPYSHFEPWERPLDYGGELVFSAGEKEFCIERNFYKKDIRQSLVCISDGEELSIEKGDLQMILGGISESIYDNTVSIGQLRSETDSGLVHELENYMSNYADAGSADVDISKAEDTLKKKKKSWESQRKFLEKQWERRQDQMEQQITYVQEEISNLEEQLDSTKHKSIELIDQNGIAARQNAMMEEELLRRQEQAEKERQEQLKRIQQEREEKRKEILKKRQEDLEVTQRYERIWKAIMMAAAVLLIVGIAGGSIMPSHLGGILAACGGALMIGSAVYQVSFRKKERIRRAAREEQLHNEWQEFLNHERDREDNGMPGKSVFSHKDILKMTTIPSEELVNRLEGQKDMLMQQLSEKKISYQNLVESQEEIMQTPEEIVHCDKEIESLELAMDIMGKMSRGIRRRIGIRLQKRMEEILDEITMGKYNRISMDEKMQITLYEWNRAVPLYQISRGTVEQVYFALRMAVTDVLCQEPMPVMLDDVFAMYDEERLSQTLKWLASRGMQVIIFTCHKREMELVKKLGIQGNIITMEDEEA